MKQTKKKKFEEVPFDGSERRTAETWKRRKQIGKALKKRDKWL